MQKKTALIQVMDPVTKQHTATIKEPDFNRYYAAVMSFANNASTGGGGASTSTKAVNSVTKKDENDNEDGDGDGWLNGLSRNDQCHVCGQLGHWSRECPNKDRMKGKGKGKGMGGSKGKGKGKGPATGCWICGGDHYQDQCPKNNTFGKGFGKEQGGGKKGFGKGGKGGWGGKGKGSLNGLHNDPLTDEDPWGWGGYAHETLCSVKTVAESARSRDNKQENMMEMQKCGCRFQCKNKFEVFMNDNDSDVEEENESDHSGFEIVKNKQDKKAVKKMIPVKNRKKWTNINIEKNETNKFEGEVEKVKPIRTIEPEGINAIVSGPWEEIELAVDSGATESVVPDSLPSSIPTTPGPASRRGVEYEVANGERLPNEGEKKFSAVTAEGSTKLMVMQVCDVNQGLLSVSKATAAGNRVVFDSHGSYIENKTSGERTWLAERNGMYTLKLWVKRPF
jgi:hypothetical protein